MRKPWVMSGFSVLIYLKNEQEAERLFETLFANGQVHMPLQKIFRAVRFEVRVDQFGLP